MAKDEPKKFDKNVAYNTIFNLLSTRPKSFSHGLDLQNEVRETLQGIHDMGYETGYLDGLEKQLENKSNNLDK